MKNNIKTITVFAILLLGVPLFLNSAPNQRVLILNVISPELIWNESNIEQKLLESFSRTQDIRVKLVSNLGEEYPSFPEDYYNFDSLLNWGAEIGGRYVVVIDVKSERLETRKSFSIPALFHKYETFGVIEGELRIIDIQRSKMAAAETFKVEKKGPRTFQMAIEDNKNDPGLHINTYDKLMFFDKLEQKLADYIKKKSQLAIGNRL